MNRQRSMQAFRIIAALVLLAGVGAAALLPGPEKVMGRYVTTLQGRTAGQRSNALLAARAVDGRVIESGHVFSFNDAVGSWTPDRGYVLAPVSYEGELVNDWGGGVCQTSTTLYNAALLAGLDVVERHRHTWAPKYVPPGRDAAVAQVDIDLRFRNPYPWPVRLRARIEGDNVGFDILGRDAGPMARVEGQAAPTVEPVEVVRSSDRLPSGHRRVVTRGRPGVRVTVYRRFQAGPRSGVREMVSQDAYPAMNRVVLVGR